MMERKGKKEKKKKKKNKRMKITPVPPHLCLNLSSFMSWLICFDHSLSLRRWSLFESHSRGIHWNKDPLMSCTTAGGAGRLAGPQGGNEVPGLGQGSGWGCGMLRWAKSACDPTGMPTGPSSSSWKYRQQQGSVDADLRAAGNPLYCEQLIETSFFSGGRKEKNKVFSVLV